MFDHSQPIGLYPFAKTSSWLTADLVVNEKGIFVNGRGLEIEIFPKVVDENFFVLFLDFVKAKTPTYSVFEKVVLELKNDGVLNKINLSLEGKIKVWKISFFETIVSEFNKEKNFGKAVESSLEQWGLKTPVLATRVVEEPQAVVEEVKIGATDEVVAAPNETSTSTVTETPKVEEPTQTPDSSETTNPNVVTDATPKEKGDEGKKNDGRSIEEIEKSSFITWALQFFIVNHLKEFSKEETIEKGKYYSKAILLLMDGNQLEEGMENDPLFSDAIMAFEEFRKLSIRFIEMTGSKEDLTLFKNTCITTYTEGLILKAVSEKNSVSKKGERPQDPISNNTSPLAKEMKVAVKAAADNWGKAPPKFPATLNSMGAAWGWDDLPYSIRMLEAEDPANAKLVRAFFEEHDFDEILSKHGAKTLKKKKEVKSIQDAVMHNRRR